MHYSPMAPQLIFYYVLFSVAVPLLGPAQSVLAQSGCSRTYSGNRLYSRCNDLPVLQSSLHWTHNNESSTLQLAFSAAPSTSSGWISWGINPNGLAMIGTQALIAFRLSNGSIDLDKYNISSYRISKSTISYEVSDLAAEYGSDGVMTIFATFKLPPGTTEVNQVWQVGPSVTGGIPVKHSFDPANLAARGTLNLVAGGVSSGVTSSRRRKANVRIQFRIVLILNDIFLPRSLSSALKFFIFFA